MRIPALESFPEIGQRAEWCRLLQIDQSTLFRAQQRGEIASIKTRTGRVLYTKAAVLAWLNLNFEPLPAVTSL